MSMTESEAIIELADIAKQYKGGTEECRIVEESLQMAIQALKKVQALEENKTYQIYREYLSIGTVSEFRELKEYKAKMEMQYLDDINNPLEPLKLSSALQSEIRKYEYRKKHMPQDISPLDYTIMYALKHCLEEQMTED